MHAVSLAHSEASKVEIDETERVFVDDSKLEKYFQTLKIVLNYPEIFLLKYFPQNISFRLWSQLK